MNARHDQHQDSWWDYARGCAAALRSGQEPPQQPLYGPLLDPNEVVRLHANAHYSRLLAGDGSYHRSSAPMLATNPLLMIGAAAAQGMVNGHRRRQATRDQEPRWDNHRPVSVLTTNQRIMCSQPNGGMLSFWYQDLDGFHPNLTTRSLTLGFEDNYCAPLQLSGPATPAIALWAATVVEGPDWENDPRLAALLPEDEHHRSRAGQEHESGLTDPEDRQWAQDMASRIGARTQTHHRNGPGLDF